MYFLPDEMNPPMDQIVRLLAAMGDTPDEVAAAVRRTNVRGLRDSTSDRNPIVRFLNRSLNIGGRMEIGAGGNILRLFLSGKTKEATLPVAVQSFLQDFHQGLYPDLEGA